MGVKIILNNKSKVSKKNIKRIENAYKKLYLKSREICSDLREHEQDIILDKVVEEKFFEKLNKIKQDGLIISEERNLVFYEELKQWMQTWKAEMKSGSTTCTYAITKKKGWEFWRK